MILQNPSQGVIPALDRAQGDGGAAQVEGHHAVVKVAGLPGHRGGVDRSTQADLKAAHCPSMGFCTR